MSWQSYVDTSLVGSGHIQKAAIVGLDGSVWAHSGGFNVAASEATGVVGNFNNPGAAQAGGVTVGGVRYLTLKADARSIYGKKGAGGVVTVKTNQCVLVGVYGEGTQPGAAANTVEKLADYLIENGY